MLKNGRFLESFPGVAAAGGVAEMEMLRTFNCGLGAIMIVSPADLQHALSMITDEHTHIVGKVKSLFGGLFLYVGVFKCSLNLLVAV